MGVIKRHTQGFGRSSRRRSGKLLRQALYQDVYAWKPFPPEFNKPLLRTKKIKPEVECCETCDGKMVDNCVTYVYGGTCEIPVDAAYVKCDYVE